MKTTLGISLLGLATLALASLAIPSAPKPAPPPEIPKTIVPGPAPEGLQPTVAAPAPEAPKAVVPDPEKMILVDDGVGYSKTGRVLSPEQKRKLVKLNLLAPEDESLEVVEYDTFSRAARPVRRVVKKPVD